MRVIPTNRARIGTHRNGGQAHPFIGAQITDHMAIVGVQRRVFVDVKGIAIFHQELAPPHHTKARPDLIPKFPLNVVERQGQLFIAFDV